jgi:uncharacterized membrane protein YeaQ/YmgE (transglycosylase-associated protein family)
MVWSVLSWIVCGFVIGLIARAIVPGRQSIGFVMTVILGVVGAFVGGLIASLIWGAPPEGNPDVNRMWPGMLLSIVGAVLVLWAYVALAGRSDTTAAPSLR